MVAHGRRITRSTDSSSKVARRYKEGLFTQYLQQITQLILDLLGAIHSLGNLIAQQLAIALPQTMNGDARRAFGHSEALADLGIARPVALSGQYAPSFLEQNRLAPPVALV